MAEYSWLGPIIIKRVRDAIVLNIRRQFSYDPLYTYVQNAAYQSIPGTVSVVANTPVVEGVGTTFTKSLNTGAMVQISGDTNTYYVQYIASDTQLKLTTNYLGATNAAATLSFNTDVSVNFDCTAITINDATPQDYYSLPTIDVMTASGEEHRFIQEDFFEEFTDKNGNQSERRGAPMDINVTIEATALDVITRDQLVDRLYEKFKIITDDLANNGIGILRTSILADRRKFENDRWYYTSGVMMHLYAEWLDEDITPLNSSLTGVSGRITTPGGINQSFNL